MMLGDDGQAAALLILVSTAGVLIGYAIGARHGALDRQWSEVRRDARILAWRAFRIWIGFPQRVRK